MKKLQQLAMLLGAFAAPIPGLKEAMGSDLADPGKPKEEPEPARYNRRTRRAIAAKARKKS